MSIPEAATSFKVFIAKYYDGSIAEDAAWRAYDIAAMANSRRMQEALKLALGYKTNPMQFAVNAVRVKYGLRTNLQTADLLILWRTWARIASGEAKGGMILRDPSAAPLGGVAQT